jgi:hypothetical protein
MEPTEFDSGVGGLELPVDCLASVVPVGIPNPHVIPQRPFFVQLRFPHTSSSYCQNELARGDASNNGVQTKEHLHLNNVIGWHVR